MRLRNVDNKRAILLLVALYCAVLGARIDARAHELIAMQHHEDSIRIDLTP